MTGTYDPTEELGRLRREADMFADLDGWLDKREAEGDPVAPRIRQTLNFTSDPQDTKTRFSIQNWVVSQTGMDPLDVADTWGQLRGQVAQELGLAPNSNDAQIHGALTAKAQKDVKKAEIRRNMHLLENPDPGEWDGLVNALKRGGLSLGQMGETFRAEMSLQVGDLLESKRKKLESDLNIRKQIDPGMEGLSELEEKLSRLGKAQTATKSLVGDDALRIASAEEAKEGYPATKVVSEFLASDTVDWGKFVENPVEIVAQVIAESLPVSVPSLAGGVAAGPAGAGAGSFITENSLGILDSMRAQGVDLRDEKQVEAFFSDPEKMLEAGRYAVRHGVPVAAFDALSFGIAGKLIGSQKGAMRKLAAGVAEMGIQSSLGAGGEALGQISATGGVENWNEVFLEAVAEIGTGTAEIGIGLLRQQAEARAASPKSADYLDGIGGEEVDTSAVTKNAAGGFTVTRPDGVSVDVGTIEEALDLAPPKPPADTMSVTEKQGIAAIPENPVFDFAKKNFRSRGDLPADAFAAKNISEAFNTSLKKEAEMNVKRLEGDISREIGAAVTPDRMKQKRKLLREANEVMTGDRHITDLPEGMRETVTAMRAHVDQLSRMMIEEGVIQGDLEPVVKANLGTYLNRSYRVFDDPKWAKNVPADIRNNAIGFLRRQTPRRDGENKSDYDTRILGIIDAILFNREGSPIEILARGKIGSKNLSVLTARKDIAPEIRALMGEYEGAIQNYAKSVFKMSALVANNRFLESVKVSAMDVYLFAEPKPGYGKQISADDSPSMAPIDGLYTTPEIAEAFKRNFSQGDVSALAQAYFALNGFAKYGKVVLSPITQVRNFLSNTFYAIALGNIPFKGGGVAMRVNMQDVLPDALLAHDPKRDEFQELYKKYTRLGLLNESVTANDFAGLLKDAFAGDVDLARFSEKTVISGSKKAIDAATKLYQAGDGFWKIANFEAEKTKLQRAYPDWTEAQIDKEAAQIVRDLTPTYSLVPPAIQKLRRFPLYGPFVSFASEVVRNNFKIAARIRYELATPELKAIGARRLAGFVTAHSLGAAMVAFGRWVTGSTEDEEDAIRELAAPWDENANILVLNRGKDGSARFINLSYIDPFSMLKNPFIAFGREGDIEEKISGALAEILGPFIGEEILSQKLLDVSRNTKAGSGTRVYNPQEDISSKIGKIAAHIAKGIEPGFVSASNRIYMAATGEEGAYGNVYNLGDEIIANTTGNRVVGVSPETSLFFRAKEFDRDTADANAIFTTVATRTGSVSVDEIKSAHSQMEAARKRAFEKFRRAYDAAIRLGLDPEKAHDTARSGGVSKGVLSSGAYSPYKLTPHQLKKLEGKDGRIDDIRASASVTLN